MPRSPQKPELEPFPGYQIEDFVVLARLKTQGAMGVTYKGLQLIGPRADRLKEEAVARSKDEHAYNLVLLKYEEFEDDSKRATQEYIEYDAIRKQKAAWDTRAGNIEVIRTASDLESIRKANGLDPVETAARLVLGKYLPHITAERDKGIREKFDREIALLTSLRSHSNLVYAHKTLTDKSGKWFITEWVEGMSLSGILSDERRTARGYPRAFDPLTASIVALKVAEGVDHLHEAGIIHKDINPSNILIGYDGEVKLIDLGIATQGPLSLEEKMEFTGTESYASPEQAELFFLVQKINRKQARLEELETIKLDHKTDIFSLGSVYYEMLTGEPPFRDLEGRSYTNILTAKPKSVKRIYKETAGFAELYSYHPEAEAICFKCLRKRPEDRYDAKELIKDLTEYLYWRGVDSTQYRTRLKKVFDFLQKPTEIAKTTDEAAAEFGIEF